jgi:DNA-binding NarL/FixJ family response regulator
MISIDGVNMRILIADDQIRVRQALRVLLTQQPGLRVIGEASDGEGLLAQVGTKAADLVLVDWELPGLVEAGGLPALRSLCPALQVVVLSSRPGVRRTAQSAGVDAFVSKGDPPESLLAAIDQCGAMVKLGGTDVTSE